MATISASPQVLVGGRAFPARLDTPRPVAPPAPAASRQRPRSGPGAGLGARTAALLLAAGVGAGVLAGAHAVSPSGPAVGSAGSVASAEGAAHPAWTVQPGDTLWAIAAQARPDADPRATVLVLRSLNDLGPQRTLQPGQVLLLPAD